MMSGGGGHAPFGKARFQQTSSRWGTIEGIPNGEPEIMN